MADQDRNRRTAGYKRVNAVWERRRAKQKFAAETSHDPTRESLVLLLKFAPAPGDDWLRQAAGRAFAGEVAEPAEADGTVRVGEWEFGVRWASRAYFEEVDHVAASVPELRLRAALREHVGWLAVEVLTGPADAADAERLARVGRLLAALAPADALALYRPGTAQVSLFTPHAAAELAAGRGFDEERRDEAA
jgi:hypothetical protein